MHANEHAEPVVVRSMKALESDQRLDEPVRMLGSVVDRLFQSPRRRHLVQGQWFGHGLHPMLTDFPLGAWMSASLLDVAGGKKSRDASTRLVGFGILAALPAAITGVAEWSSAGHRERRVGVVHGAANTAALGLYSLSYLARRRRHVATGFVLGVAGGLVATGGGYLGGHLTEARKVSSRHPAFEETGDGGVRTP